MRSIISAMLMCLVPAVAFGQVWTYLPDMNSARADHAAAAYGTDLYVFGGWDTSSFPDESIEKLDTVTGVWTSVANPLAVSFIYADAVAVGTTIHIIGAGATGVVSFDVATQTWTDSLGLPQSMWGGQAVHADNRIWVIGGALDFTNPSSVLSTVYVSNDLAASGGVIDSWTLYEHALPSPLVRHQAAVSNGVIYVAGGSSSPAYPGTPTNQILSLDPAGGGWVVEGSLPSAVSSHAGAALGARFFALGGIAADGANINQNAVFVTLTGSVASGSGGWPLYGAQATPVGDLIYLTGGYYDGNWETYRLCHAYDPTADGFPVAYSIGGSVSGLVGEMTLQLNGGGDYVVEANGPFVFPTRLSGGAPYEVTIASAPIGLECSVANGSGVMGLAPVTDVTITCVPAPPTITSIADVPGDQGRKVRLRWSRNIYDSGPAAEPVTSYAVFRRIDVARKSAQRAPVDGILAYPPGDWDFVASVPAFQEDTYALVVPTLADSTVTAGMFWSVFFVRAATADPGRFFDSPPDSGWSVDNLAPSTPQNLFLAGDQLMWDEPVDGDFNHFSVYGSVSGDVDGNEILIGHATSPLFDIAGHSHAFFLVTATDFAGNEGSAASLAVGISEVTGTAPARTLLLGNHPNPFNPQTTIAFELGKRETVSLRVFDVSGRLVDVLIDNEIAAPGRNEVVWRGRDIAGRIASAGVYFYRLEAGTFSETKRMMLVK